MVRLLLLRLRAGVESMSRQTIDRVALFLLILSGWVVLLTLGS